MTWLGMGVRPRAPRPELKAQVLARAFAARPPRAAWWPLARAAVLLLALGGVGWAAWQIGRLRAERAQLAAHLAAVRDTLALVRSPAPVHHIPVVTAGRAGTITIFTDTTTHRWLVACNGIAPNAPGETYQIWFVTATGVQSAMVMPMHDDQPMVAAAPMPEVAVVGVAMSVEPAGGSPAPRGQLLFKRML